MRWRRSRAASARADRPTRERSPSRSRRRPRARRQLSQERCMSFDTVVRGGTIDVAIADGVIAEVAPGGELGAGRETIDATGLLVLPGLVDAHVHLNDPGRAEWEGFAAGTAALRRGGPPTAPRMAPHRAPP